ncbi:UPF0225 protein [Virgisporangium aliadipatigenens]|uniref:UPF0225 protein Val02_23030 n=1 Tax=Virgisporangium aliadipatigenens TaxID=741659 RepID=A0A8J4DQI7_9ACTN|nr:YchJ family protein [Virgisporangium aliadipatigenens]GIJ45417.1 UPF0225 protein [Virgisporangium aliadipatigenens]
MPDLSLCPCGLGDPYPDCCGRFHDGSDVPATAEALMRSRYSAFAVRDAAYLLRSWHPRTRPRRLEFDPEQRWLRLEILDTADGGLFDSQGTVEFRAHHRSGGRRGRLHERSRFARHEGRWVYVDGEIRQDGT